MYILALLFGIVNFYFLLSALIVILSLFTEYVQVPLINYGAKLFHLPISYTLERSYSPHSNSNIFNTIMNQNQTKPDESDNTDDTDDANDANDTDDANDANDTDTDKEESNIKCDFLKPDLVEQSQESNSDPENKTEESDEETTNKQLKSNSKKPEEIFIDETLD